MTVNGKRFNSGRNELVNFLTLARCLHRDQSALDWGVPDAACLGGVRLMVTYFGLGVAIFAPEGETTCQMLRTPWPFVSPGLVSLVKV